MFVKLQCSQLAGQSAQRWGDRVRARVKPQTRPEAHCAVTPRARGPSGHPEIAFGAMERQCLLCLSPRQAGGRFWKGRCSPLRILTPLAGCCVVHSMCWESPWTPKKSKAQSQGQHCDRHAKSLSQKGTLIPRSSCCHEEDRLPPWQGWGLTYGFCPLAGSPHSGPLSAIP